MPPRLFTRRIPPQSGLLPVRWTFGAFLLVFACASQADAQGAAPPPSGLKPGLVVRTGYAGDEACASCHQDKAATYQRTAHAGTSSLPSGETIHGSFRAGANILRTANPDLYFQMEARPEGFFQTGVLRTSSTEVLTRSERFDIVVGSGRKGQTYLFWDGDQLYQLPVSYWTQQGVWVNSPGYIDGTADFERPIPRRCLECHASSFASRAPPENLYRKTSLGLGISCEKCHGPGGEHVARYRAKTPPQSLAEAAIINPAKLSRDRQIDVCCLCHAGAGDPLTPPLSFTPGDVLAKHLVFPQQAPSAHIDVHASQVQLLERSRCFQSSPAMTCATCHDVHKPDRDLAALASRCLTCHQVESCRVFPKQGQKIANQCVTCHMPLEQTEQILISDEVGRNMQTKVRNHQIAIYPNVHLP